jgi:NADH-quinone oxidoreductase subunit C
MLRNKPEEVLREKFGNQVSISDENKHFPVLIIETEDLMKVIRFCFESPELFFNFLENMTALDYGERFSILYQLYSTQHKHRLNLECRVLKNTRKLNSASGFWRAALSFESEIQEMFGLQFKDALEPLRALFLPEGWEGHPLLKRYEYPLEYKGVSHACVDIKKEHKRPGVL